MSDMVANVEQTNVWNSAVQHKGAAISSAEGSEAYGKYIPELGFYWPDSILAIVCGWAAPDPVWLSETQASERLLVAKHDGPVAVNKYFCHFG